MFSAQSRLLIAGAVLATLGACSKASEKTQAQTINPSEGPISTPPASPVPAPAAAPVAVAPAPAPAPVETEAARRARVEREELEAERAAFAEARARVAAIEHDSARAQSEANSAAAAGQGARQRDAGLSAQARALAEENAYLQGEIDGARQAGTNPLQGVIVAPGFASGGRGSHKPPRVPRGNTQIPIVGNPPGPLQPFTALPGGSFMPPTRSEKRDTTDQR